MPLFSKAYNYIKVSKLEKSMSDSKFLKVKCKKCKNEQVVFNKAASVVKCLVCESVLVEPRGGMADIKTKVLEVVGENK